MILCAEQKYEGVPFGPDFGGSGATATTVKSFKMKREKKKETKRSFGGTSSMCYMLCFTLYTFM